MSFALSYMAAKWHGSAMSATQSPVLPCFYAGTMDR